MTPLAFFLNGWGLVSAGAALTAVPILIHLLNRRRVRVVRWAAMAWLLAAMRRNQRRLKLENWLILALRVAAVLLLGVALARPVLTDSALSALAGAIHGEQQGLALLQCLGLGGVGLAPVRADAAEREAVGRQPLVGVVGPKL